LCFLFFFFVSLRDNAEGESGADGSAGGDATLVRAREIEGLPNEKLIELFNTVRAKEYATLRELLRGLSRKKRSSSTFAAKLDRVRNDFGSRTRSSTRLGA
jgi:hypothetical protein